MPTRKTSETYQRWLSSVTFEKYVEGIYKGLLREHRSKAKVFRDRKYLGRRSQHNHQIDVSVELSVSGLAFLVLFECKHFKSRVKAEHVLAFAERLSDIGAQKGVMVTTVGFQSGAIKVADGHSIALVQTVPTWRWVRHMRKRGMVVAATVGHVYAGPRRSEADVFMGVAPALVQEPLPPAGPTPSNWRRIVR